MKRQLVRQCLGLAVGLGLLSGCAKPSAQSDQPKAVVAPPAPTLAVPPNATLAGPPPPVTPAPVATSAPPTAVAQDTNGPAIEQRIAPAQPANMSPGIDELVRLAQGGVSEEVMVAFIEKYPGKFDASADQIVFLNDLGVTSNVVTAMLKHDGVAAPAASVEPTTPTPTTQPNPQVSNVPPGGGLAGPIQPEPGPAAPVQNSAPAVVTPPATPPPSSDVGYFYDSLSPYGSWMYVSGYGWCWQPTVAMTVGDWRPYSYAGSWYWSDSGWYWHSDYSWGWAPFHYGRWYMHPRAGWIWTPGTVWGPAWVSWRYSEGYCGWAPLPPEAYWVPGVGFTYYGHHVAIGFDFGLSWHHYGFVPIGHFCDPHPHHYFVGRANVVNVYHNTKVVNNYYAGRGGALVNRGVGRETIARQAGANVRQVRVEPTSFAGGANRLNKLDRRGREVVAYRPELPKEPPVKPAAVQSRMAQDARQPQRMARVENTPTTANFAPRSGRGTVAESGPRPTAPAATPNTPNRRDPIRIDRQSAAAANEPRATAPRQTEPRQNDSRPAAPSARPESRPTAPDRSTPGRIERNNRSEATPQSGVARTETPVTRAPAAATPSAPVTRAPSAAAPVVRTPSAAQNNPRPVYAEPRSPAAVAPRASAPAIVTPPAVPRAVSPRYGEQIGGQSYASPGRPSTPSYSAPTYTAPRASGGGNAAPAPRVERGGGTPVSRGEAAGRVRERN